MDFPGLRSSLRAVQDRIRHHQGIGGWTHPVRIVAVTKTHGAEAVRAAVAAGLLDIGENRVQEALAKQDQLRDLPVRWHLIGTLQRNKVRHAVGRFALIHSVDRAELADELARRMPPGGRQPVLVEVNCSGESQKGGVEPAGLPALLDRISRLPSLELQGLMTMAALTADVAYYQRLIAMDRDEAADIIETELPRLGLPRLYDELMIPALSYARRDRERDVLSDEQFEFAVRTSRELIDQIVAPTAPLAEGVRSRIIGCPGRDEADEVAVHMLATVLAPSGVVVEEVSSEHLTAEVVALVESTAELVPTS